MKGLALHPGLVWLLRRTPLVLVRGVRKRVKGVKGVLLALFVTCFAVLVIGMTVVQSIMEESDPVLMAERARAFGPLALLSMTAMTMLAPAQRRGLYFKPAEVGLLFPAPFSRRQLLAYHVLSRAQIQVLSALWVSIFVMRYAPTWYGCILGILFALLFLQLLSQAIALLTAAAGQRIARPIRWLVLGGALAAVVLGGSAAISKFRIDRGIPAALEALTAHPVVRIVTLPFVPFANTFAATSIIDALLWCTVSAALLLALVVAIARLDVAYEEAAIDVSRQVRRSLERMRSGGGAMALMGPSKARFSVPRLPRMGGVGPIAWRQCVEITRNQKSILTSLVILLLWPAMMGGTVFFAAEDAEGMQKGAVAAILLVMLFSILWTQNIAFDFRRDLDRIAYLRSLPISAMAVATGQIAPTSILLASMQFLIVGGVIVVADLLPWIAVPALLPLLFVFAWVVVALDNVLFLFFPHRIDPDDAGNVGFMGKLMLVMSLKFIALFGVILGAGGVGTACGLLVRYLGLPIEESVIVGVLVGTALVVAANVLLTYLVARAYDAFDPGRDVPA